MPRYYSGGRAGGTIRTSRLVKGGSADFTFLEADAGDQCVGVSQEGAQDAPAFENNANAAEDGDAVKIYPIGEECLVVAGGTVTRFTPCAADADGKIVHAVSTDYIAFLPFESGVSGDHIRGIILPPTIKA